MLCFCAASSLELAGVAHPTFTLAAWPECATTHTWNHAPNCAALKGSVWNNGPLASRNLRLFDVTANIHVGCDKMYPLAVS